MSESREIGRVAKGSHGALVVTAEPDQSVAITFWVKPDGAEQFTPTKQRVMLRNATELLGLGRLLRMAYDTLSKDNPFSRKHRQPTAVTSAPANDVDWSKHF